MSERPGAVYALVSEWFISSRPDQSAYKGCLRCQLAAAMRVTYKAYALLIAVWLPTIHPLVNTLVLRFEKDSNLLAPDLLFTLVILDLIGDPRPTVLVHFPFLRLTFYVLRVLPTIHPLINTLVPD